MVLHAGQSRGNCQTPKTIMIEARKFTRWPFQGSIRENIKATKDIWGFGHRREYTTRLRGAGMNIAEGPYTLNQFWVREIEWEGSQKCGWSSSGTAALRKLALAFWVGSEFDVAVIRTDPSESDSGRSTRVFHCFDALTNIILQVTHPFLWDEDAGCHLTGQEYDRVSLITNLLTCYNAVFVDDAIAGKSWVFFHNILPVAVPEKIRIQQDDGKGTVYLQSETQKYTLNAGIEKPAHRLVGSRRLTAPPFNAGSVLRAEPFQVNLESWRECDGDIDRWVHMKNTRREQALQFAATEEETEQRIRKQRAGESLRSILMMQEANPQLRVD
jgi:hypothetical protein